MYFGGCLCCKLRNAGRARAAPSGKSLAVIDYRAPPTEHIHIDAKAMTIVQTQDENEFGKGDLSDRPTSTKTVTLVDAKLPEEKLKELAAFVRETGFMALKISYGAPEGMRSLSLCSGGEL